MSFPLPIFVATAVGAMLCPASARAGWVTITNETPAIVVIVDASPGKIRPRPVRLMPGEVYREYLPGTGEKKVQLYDPLCPTKPVFQGPVKWTPAEVRLSVQTEGTSIVLGPPPIKPAVANADKPK